MAIHLPENNLSSLLSDDEPVQPQKAHIHCGTSGVSSSCKCNSRIEKRRCVIMSNLATPKTGCTSAELKLIGSVRLSVCTVFRVSNSVTNRSARRTQRASVYLHLAECEACARCEAATVRSFVLALSALHLTHSDTPPEIYFNPNRSLDTPSPFLIRKMRHSGILPASVRILFLATPRRSPLRLRLGEKHAA